MSSSLPVVLVLGQVHYAKETVNRLSSEYQFVTVDSSSREEFFQQCQDGGKYSSAQAIYTNGTAGLGAFDSEFVKALPASLKVVAHHGAGYDPIDVAACSQRKIQVSNTPGAVDHGTATVALFLILSSLRNLWKAQLQLHAGVFKEGTSPAWQYDPEGKTLLIVGMGGIGRALAKRALAFDMKIMYHNRKPVAKELLAEFPPNTITYCPTLAEALPLADVVSLHVPLNDHTNKFFAKKEFAQMKKGACLINTARGGVVDEEALLDALESGQLGSAGLDVFPSEPQVNPRLIANDRLTLLPHMGTETYESRLGMENTVLENIRKGLKDGRVVNGVPEQDGMF